MRTGQSAVKRIALEKGLEVFQPASLKEPAALEKIAAARPEALVVAAYGLLLPEPVLKIAPRGAINIHASLLPRWRGAAPIQRALLAGDRQTGISIMQMDAGLDTGPVLARHPLPIGRDDDFQTLHDKLAALGAELLLEVLADIEAGRARSRPQSAEGATYAHKIDKAETQLDWTRDAVELERVVRAFRPAPGATTRLAQEPLKIWRSRVVAAHGEPGTVLAQDGALIVACGRGALEITELQAAGGRRMSAADFTRGRRLPPGTRLQ